jgi:2-polyprenyl-3-methyl-5-hydroxy-6-metoxy-1,4-benzoquinol methylase
MRGPLARTKRFLREGKLSGPPYRMAAALYARARIALCEAWLGRYHTAEQFDREFTSNADPWGYERDPVAGERKALLLDLLPRRRMARLLEIGCAAGWITRELAARAERVVALDVSRVALDLARARCADCRNVEFRRFDLLQDALDGVYDAAVCAGVLVYLPWKRQAGVRDAIVAALEPGATLLLEHCRDAFPGEVAGSRIHALYAAHPRLAVTARERRDIYEIVVFRRA